MKKVLLLACVLSLIGGVVHILLALVASQGAELYISVQPHSAQAAYRIVEYEKIHWFAGEAVCYFILAILLIAAIRHPKR